MVRARVDQYNATLVLVSERKSTGRTTRDCAHLPTHRQGTAVSYAKSYPKQACQRSPCISRFTHTSGLIHTPGCRACSDEASLKTAEVFGYCDCLQNCSQAHRLVILLSLQFGLRTRMVGQAGDDEISTRIWQGLDHWFRTFGYRMQIDCGGNIRNSIRQRMKSDIICEGLS